MNIFHHSFKSFAMFVAVGLATIASTATVQAQQNGCGARCAAGNSGPKLGFHGTIEGRGLRINSVQWNSPAQQIGLETGDVITHVNGHRIYSFNDYFEALNAAQAHGIGARLRIINVRYPHASRHRIVYRTYHFGGFGGGQSGGG